MRLIKQQGNADCVAAALAMVLNEWTGGGIDYIKTALFSYLPKPFTGEWSDLPKVPDMNIICNWAWDSHSIALVPFEYSPTCTPARGCPPVPVWPRNTRSGMGPEEAWLRHLSYGPGLLEGSLIGREVGHMVAWSGDAIYDPRGYIYSLNVAQEKFKFQPARFWLAANTRK